MIRVCDSRTGTTPEQSDLISRALSAAVGRSRQQNDGARCIGLALMAYAVKSVLTGRVHPTSVVALRSQIAYQLQQEKGAVPRPRRTLTLRLADLSIKKRQLSPDIALESERILGGLYHNYRAKAA